jgi:putative DNA primase/helicase
MNEQKTNTPGNVLIAAGEDIPEYTIAPRLRAMGADLSRVYYLYGREGKDGKETPWTIGDIETVKDAIRQIGGIRLFIIDPLEYFIGGDVDVYRNNEVRAALRAIMDLAKEENFTILAIQHLNKTTGAQALYRFAGSIAFAAAARTVWQVTKEKDRPGYLFANTKMNIARAAPTYRYTIEDVDGIGIPAWDCIVETDAETAMNGQGGRDTPAQNEVLEIIRCKHPSAVKVSDIVEATGKNKPNISNILKELVKAGKIKKSDVLSGYYSYIEQPEKSSFCSALPIGENERTNEQETENTNEELDIF